MANSDDSFIREVNEELRSDQVKYAWKRFRPLVIGLVVLIVGGAIGRETYNWWAKNNSSASGDKFLAALQLAEQNKNDEALAAFAALEKDGTGAYPVLAKMRAASIQQAKGDAAGAIAAFSAIGKDNGAPQAMRDLAKMRAAWLMIDTATYEQVSAEVEVMAVPANPLANSAREALGLSAYKSGDMKKAKDWFQQIANDAGAPRNVANRAQIMLDNIAATGKAS
ncbi:tetratricopeptide repeat protein [Rhizobium sp. XQZ8]|uniref:tetratricopeptide repeat protein n=1 Tax=Rhizobium populisoli TaxID=2859785 RepID=UPI001CA506BC|nr:tetratricopeptide repeat protein [Rhizobium populisoli]MBW6423111.1 tetratricopeptide repeat protein [Rhizobium populisoli]